MPRLSIIADQFDAIARTALVAADAIDCTPAEYRAGLQYIVEEFTTAIAASNESTGPADDDDG